jgi:hypothetical protein
MREALRTIPDLGPIEIKGVRREHLTDLCVKEEVAA